MKKAEREPYLILNKLSLPNGGIISLCSWCKYAQWEGYCEELECDCKHPLWRVRDYVFDDAVQGGDCWGFRPQVSREDAVDMVGIWLTGKAVDWSTIPVTTPSAKADGFYGLATEAR
jgi:hypothetical protein